MGFVLKGRWAVITGASAGIGKYLAMELARRGCHLVLVARRQGLLDKLAEDLSSKFAISTEVIGADLTDQNASEALIEAIGDKPISILINNAGFAQTGTLDGGDWSKLRAMIQLNLVFLAGFTHAMLPRLKAAPNGARIMNVGSLAGYMGVPYMCTYSATKAFVNHFSEGLAWELADSQVRVTSLEPGSTRTAFFAVAGMQEAFMSRFNVMVAEKVARLGVKAMVVGRARLVTGLVNKLGVFGLRLSPRWLIGIVVRRLFQDVK